MYGSMPGNGDFIGVPPRPQDTTAPARRYNTATHGVNPAMRPLLVLAVFALALRADGPGDNIPDKVRPVPPRGVAIPDKDRAFLGVKLKTLQAAIAELP